MGIGFIYHVLEIAQFISKWQTVRPIHLFCHTYVKNETKDEGQYYTCLIVRNLLNEVEYDFLMKNMS